METKKTVTKQIKITTTVKLNEVLEKLGLPSTTEFLRFCDDDATFEFLTIVEAPKEDPIALEMAPGHQFCLFIGGKGRERLGLKKRTYLVNFLQTYIGLNSSGADRLAQMYDDGVEVCLGWYDSNCCSPLTGALKGLWYRIGTAENIHDADPAFKSTEVSTLHTSVVDMLMR
jgi:hypothetical protein